MPVTLKQNAFKKKYHYVCGPNKSAEFSKKTEDGSSNEPLSKHQLNGLFSIESTLIAHKLNNLTLDYLAAAKATPVNQEKLNEIKEEILKTTREAEPSFATYSINSLMSAAEKKPEKNQDYITVLEPVQKYFKAKAKASDLADMAKKNDYLLQLDNFVNNEENRAFFVEAFKEHGAENACNEMTDFCATVLESIEQSYIDLCDAYRREGNNEAAQEVIEEAVAKKPRIVDKIQLLQKETLLDLYKIYEKELTNKTEDSVQKQAKLKELKNQIKSLRDEILEIRAKTVTAEHYAETYQTQIKKDLKDISDEQLANITNAINEIAKTDTKLAKLIEKIGEKEFTVRVLETLRYKDQSKFDELTIKSGSLYDLADIEKTDVEGYKKHKQNQKALEEAIEKTAEDIKEFDAKQKQPGE